MNIRPEAFSVPKRGNREDENDDAFWPKKAIDIIQSPVAFVALADGATESIFARQWADELVKAVGEGRLSPRETCTGVCSLRAAWRELIGGKKNLPWYAEEKARQGTYAALIALELRECELGTCWHAAALGDSCLFQIRGDEVLVRFPLESSSAFDNRPFLLGSVGGDEELLAERIRRCKGTWERGDVFYLMSDALACWFLRQTEEENGPVAKLRDHAVASKPDFFTVWIEALRDKGSIRNDDSTVMRVTLL